MPAMAGMIVSFGANCDSDTGMSWKVVLASRSGIRGNSDDDDHIDEPLLIQSLRLPDIRKFAEH